MAHYSRSRFSLPRIIEALILPRLPEGRAFAPSEWRTLAAIAEIVREGAPAERTGEQIANNVEAFLTAGQSRRAWRIRALLRLLEYLPLRDTGLTLTSMAPGARSKLIREKFQHAQGLWWIAAKARYLVFMGLYGGSSAPLATGFKPPRERARYADYSFPDGPGTPSRVHSEPKVDS